MTHIDDNFLQGSTFKEYQLNIISTVWLKDSLGLTVHLEKINIDSHKTNKFF